MKEIFIKLAEILPGLQVQLGAPTLKLYSDFVEVTFKTSSLLHSIPMVDNSEVSIFADSSGMLNIRFIFNI